MSGNERDAAADDPRGAAREQFVHGLLETMHKDDAAQIERRVAGVLERIEAPIAIRRTRRPWTLLSGLAAAIVLVVAGVLWLPTQRTAAAMVQAAVAASRTAGDRRYDMRATFDDGAGEIHYATLDVRNPDCYVIRAILSKGDDLVVGRDAQGDWALKFGGEIDRLPPRKLLPAWVNSGQGAVGLVSVDDVLGELGSAYTLRRGADAADPRGVVCERISAERASGESAGPRTVEIWLDARTHVPRWMEVFWDPPVPGAAADKGPDIRRPRGPGTKDGRPFSNPFTDRRTPPRKLVFELTGTDDLGAAWFTPETHSRIRREGM